jgi:RNA polymerase sigma factor (sigma-70 family)
VSRCLAGDHTAWSTLLDRYERLIVGVAGRQGLSENQVADVFQNVSLAMLRALEQLRDVDYLAGWLATTTRRESWRELRRQEGSAGETELLSDTLPGDSPGAEETMARWEEFRALHAALEESGGRCQALLRRLYFTDPAARYEEIAAELGVPVGSIGPTRARCLKKLRERMHLMEWHALR